MQRVKRANAKNGSIPSGEVGAGLPGVMRKAHASPYSICTIALKITPNLSRVWTSQSLQKHLLENRVCHFGTIEVSDLHGRGVSHTPVNAHGVRVRDVACNQEA